MKNLNLYLIALILIFNDPSLCAAEAKSTDTEHYDMRPSHAFKPIPQLGPIPQPDVAIHPSLASQLADFDLKYFRTIQSNKKYHIGIPGTFRPITQPDSAHILPRPDLYLKGGARRKRGDKADYYIASAASTAVVSIATAKKRDQQPTIIKKKSKRCDCCTIC